MRSLASVGLYYWPACDVILSILLPVCRHTSPSLTSLHLLYTSLLYSQLFHTSLSHMVLLHTPLSHISIVILLTLTLLLVSHIFSSRTRSSSTPLFFTPLPLSHISLFSHKSSSNFLLLPVLQSPVSFFLYLPFTIDLLQLFYTLFCYPIFGPFIYD